MHTAPPRPQPGVCPPPRPVSLLGLGLGLGAAAHPAGPASMFCPQTGLAGRPLSVPPQDPSPSPAGHGFYTHVLVVRAFSVCPHCGTAGVRGQAGPCPLARWRPCPAPGPRPRSARPACRRALRLVLSSCFPRGPPDGGDCCQTPFFKKINEETEQERWAVAYGRSAGKPGCPARRRRPERICQITGDCKQAGQAGAVRPVQPS